MIPYGRQSIDQADIDAVIDVYNQITCLKSHVFLNLKPL